MNPLWIERESGFVTLSYFTFATFLKQLLAIFITKIISKDVTSCTLL